MGQRHQVFLRTLNPVKVLDRRIPKEKKKEYQKKFGTGKYTVLAFHHQWLFGMSAVFNAAKVLDFAERLNKKGKKNDYYDVFSEGGMGYSFYSVEEFVQVVRNLMAIVTDPDHPRGVGIENFWLLNDEEPEMKDSYDIGDNNDGITIIDLISRKYCFMNIGGDSRVEVLPRDTPVSAKEYVRGYYPTSKEDFDAYFKVAEYSQEDIEDEFKDSSMEEQIAENIKFCKKGLKRMELFEVLTKSEINKIFPKAKVK